MSGVGVTRTVPLPKERSLEGYEHNESRFTLKVSYNTPEGIRSTPINITADNYQRVDRLSEFLRKHNNNLGVEFFYEGKAIDRGRFGRRLELTYNLINGTQVENGALTALKETDLKVAGAAITGYGMEVKVTEHRFRSPEQLHYAIKLVKRDEDLSALGKAGLQ